MTKVKIIHIIDHLGQGGSQELLQEMIRLGDLSHFEYAVTSVFAAVPKGDHALAIRSLGATTYTLSHRLMPIRFSGFFGAIRFIVDLCFFILLFPVLVWKFAMFVRRERGDIIHAHFLFAYPIAICAGIFLRRPVVFTIPALQSQMDAYSKMIFPLYRLCALFTSHFFTALPEDTPHARLRIDPVRISNFLGVVDGEIARQRDSGKNPITEEFDLGTSPMILSVGRFEPEKGHDLVLRAFAILKKNVPSARLIILGEGKLRYTYEAYIQEHDLGDSVSLPGFRDDAAYFYARADVFARAFLYEGMNTSLQWALAYRKVIVALDNHSPTELLRDKVSALMVPMGSSSILADALERALYDQSLRASLVAGAGEVFKERLDIRRSVSIFEDIYMRIVSR